jgi:hypothetical protein
MVLIGERRRRGNHRRVGCLAASTCFAAEPEPPSRAAFEVRCLSQPVSSRQKIRLIRGFGLISPVDTVFATTLGVGGRYLAAGYRVELFPNRAIIY